MFKIENKSIHDLISLVDSKNKIFNKREDIIKDIKKNNKIFFNYRITNYIESSYFETQKLLDFNFIKQDYENRKILIEEKYIFYTNITSKDNYIQINKNSNISKEIIFIVNQKKYIYAIGYLEYIETLGEFEKFRIIINEDLNSFRYNKINEDMYIMLIENECDKRIYEIYYKISSNKYINESIYGYLYKIEKYEIKEINEILDNLNIDISNNKISSIYSSEYFCLIFFKIYPNLIISFSDEAEEILLNNKIFDFKTILNDISNLFIKYNEKITISDLFGNNLSITKIDVIKGYIKSYISRVESEFKIKINSYKLLLNPLFEDFDNYRNKIVAINQKYIDKNKKDYSYIFIYLDDYEFKICEVHISIDDFVIIYNIDIKVKVNVKNNFFTEVEFLNKLELLIFENMNNNFNEGLFNYEDSFMAYLKKTDRLEIEKNLKKRYYYIEKTKLEEIKKFDEKAFKMKYMSRMIKKIYLENPNLDNIKIAELEINRRYIDEIIMYLSYYSVKEFFNQIDFSNLIKNFFNIKIYGKLLKTNSFLEVLKEYVPGRILDFSLVNDKYLEILNQNDRDIIEGHLKIKEDYLNMDYKILIYYQNYKKEIKNLIDNLNSKNYLDKLETTKEFKLNLKYIFEYIEEVNKEIIIKIENNFIEMDEDEILREEKIKINEIELNEIVNSVIRIFFQLDKGILNMYFIKRKDNQLYFYKSEKNIEFDNKF